MRARVTRAEVLVQSGLTRVPFRPVPGHARRRATSCLGRRSGTDVLRPDSIASVDCTLRVKWNAKLADYDWDALSSAATLLPAPARLTAALDRDECLARHAHLERRERDLDKARQLRTAKAIIGPGKRSSALPQLDSVVLRDGFLFSASSVSLDQPTIGKLLPVRIISQPLRTVSVQFVVEDARGNPLPVQLFHVPTTSITQEQLQDWFPIGAIFGIKEPLFRSLNDGSYYIRIETPVDMVRLYPRSPLLTNVRFPSPRTATNLGPGAPTSSHWLDPIAESPARLKEAGDKAFAMGRLVRAQEAYQLALDALQQSDPSPTPLSDDDRSLLLLLRVKVHANLAQTLLRLELPESAHRAAQAGLLALDDDLESSSSISSSSSLRIKLLYRRALGLYRVGQYDLALNLCEEAIRRSIAAAAADHPDKNNDHNSDREATALLERIKQRQLEAERGPSAATLRSLWASSVVERRRQRASSPSPSPSPAAEVDLPADWIDSSSISISPHIPGKQGHGLVALRPIKRGQLLMCCTPLASAGGGGTVQGQLRYRYTVGVNLWTRSEDPWAVREVVSQILWRAALEDEGDRGGGGGGGGGTREAIAPLWAGTQLGRCRDRRPPEDEQSRLQDVDVVSPSKVEGAVTFNGFHLEDVTASSAAASSKSSLSTADGRDDAVPDQDELFHAPTALYPEYPSALNHSCLSNCTYTFLSSVFLLRARVDIAQGEELVDSYVDAADQLEVRAAKLAAHGFECACPLCVEERQAGATVRRRRVELVRRAEGLDEPRRGGLDELGQIVAELEQTYPAAAHIRPALYTPLRLLSEALAAAAATTPGGGPPLPPPSDPIANELCALQSLGARFSTGPSEGLEELVEPPRVRDMDGVMSALWIAKEWRRRGKPEKCRHWISLARTIEAGQAGEELFDLRYGDWARKHGLDLKL